MAKRHDGQRTNLHSTPVSRLSLGSKEWSAREEGMRSDAFRKEFHCLSDRDKAQLKKEIRFSIGKSRRWFKESISMLERVCAARYSLKDEPFGRFMALLVDYELNELIMEIEDFQRLSSMSIKLLEMGSYKSASEMIDDLFSDLGIGMKLLLFEMEV